VKSSERIFSIVAALLMAAGIATPLEAQRNCVKGKPCGNSCIARNKVCRIGAASPERPAAATVVPVARDSLSPWIASKAGTIFYRNSSGCEVSRVLAPQNLVYFKDERAAAAAGYKRSKEDGC
jgi:predicted DNA-binding transcriptional regulator YafY